METRRNNVSEPDYSYSMEIHIKKPNLFISGAFKH